MYTSRGEVTLSKLFYPSEKGPAMKGNSLLTRAPLGSKLFPFRVKGSKFFSFREDSFSEGTFCK